MLDSLWNDSGHLGFFIWLSIMLLAANSSLISIGITYFGLNNKNYDW